MSQHLFTEHYTPTYLWVSSRCFYSKVHQYFIPIVRVCLSTVAKGNHSPVNMILGLVIGMSFIGFCFSIACLYDSAIRVPLACLLICNSNTPSRQLWNEVKRESGPLAHSFILFTAVALDFLDDIMASLQWFFESISSNTIRNKECHADAIET